MTTPTIDPTATEEFSEGCAELLNLVDEMRYAFFELRQQKAWEDHGFTTEREWLERGFRPGYCLHHPGLGISYDLLMTLLNQNGLAFFNGLGFDEVQR